MPERSRPLFVDIALGLIVAIVFYIALRLLWFTRAFVLVIILGLIFGTTLDRAAGVLQAWHVRRSIGAVLIVLLVAAAITGAAWLIAPRIGSQLRDVNAHIPEALDRLEDVLRNRTIAGVDLSTPDLNSPRVLRRFAGQYSKALTPMLFPFLTNSLAALAGFLVIIFIAIYLASEPSVYVRGFVRLFHPARRERVDSLLRDAGAVVRQWLVARLLAMIAIGIVTGCALWAIGVPAAAALGAIAGLLEFIPFFGPIASAVPALAMGFMVSPATALYVALIFVGIQQLEGNVLTPLIMRSRIDVPPLLTIVAVTALGMIFGVLGMLVAEPVTAVSIVLVRSLWVEPVESRAGHVIDSSLPATPPR